jgi:hypothetical protein
VRAEVAKRRSGPGSPLSFLFVAVFVDMIGYGIVVPLLPFYAREHASGGCLRSPNWLLGLPLQDYTGAFTQLFLQFWDIRCGP